MSPTVGTGRGQLIAARALSSDATRRLQLTSSQRRLGDDRADGPQVEVRLERIGDPVDLALSVRLER